MLVWKEVLRVIRRRRAATGKTVGRESPPGGAEVERRRCQEWWGDAEDGGETTDRAKLRVRCMCMWGYEMLRVHHHLTVTGGGGG